MEEHCQDTSFANNEIKAERLFDSTSIEFPCESKAVQFNPILPCDHLSQLLKHCSTNELLPTPFAEQNDISVQQAIKAQWCGYTEKVVFQSPREKTARIFDFV